MRRGISLGKPIEPEPEEAVDGPTVLVSPPAYAGNTTAYPSPSAWYHGYHGNGYMATTSISPPLVVGQEMVGVTSFGVADWVTSFDNNDGSTTVFSTYEEG